MAQDGKENLAAEDLGSIPGSGRSAGEGHGNPLQYSCPENPMDRGAWRATVHRVAESDMTEGLMLTNFPGQNRGDWDSASPACQELPA